MSVNFREILNGFQVQRNGCQRETLRHDFLSTARCIAIFSDPELLTDELSYQTDNHRAECAAALHKRSGFRLSTLILRTPNNDQLPTDSCFYWHNAA